MRIARDYVVLHIGSVRRAALCHVIFRLYVRMRDAR